MAGSISEVKVWPNKSGNKSVLANAQFVYDGVLKVKCTLWSGKQGPWIGFPGNTGKKMDENGKPIFYPNVTCLDDGVKEELTKAVMAKYNEEIGNDGMNQGEAPGPTPQAQGSKRKIPF